MKLYFAGRPEFLVLVQQAVFCVLMGSVPVHGGHIHALSSSGVSLLIFLPTCFSARTVVLALNSQPHTLSLHSCIWPSLDDLGPAKATETPVRHVPPASCEHGWCSALGVVASNAQEGELPWTSLCLQWLFLEGGQPARNTSCSISAFPLFPISQSDAV